MRARLRVATWNVHSCIGMDGRSDVDRVAEVVRELDADLVGLQELDDRENHPAEQHLAALAARTGLRPISCPTIWGTHGGFGNALLSRRRPHRVRTVDLSVSRREPRRALDADVLLDPGHHLRVVVTHLGLRLWERGQQIERLLRLLDEHDERPLLLLGDLNEWRQRGYILRALEDRFGEGTSVKSWPSRIPSMALDRIYVSPPSRVLRAWAHDTPEARLASDHLPVVAEVELDVRDEVSPPAFSG